jgi:hypothetical protein
VFHCVSLQAQKISHNADSTGSQLLKALGAKVGRAWGQQATLHACCSSGRQVLCSVTCRKRASHQ